MTSWAKTWSEPTRELTGPSLNQKRSYESDRVVLNNMRITPDPLRLESAEARSAVEANACRRIVAVVIEVCCHLTLADRTVDGAAHGQALPNAGDEIVQRKPAVRVRPPREPRTIQPKARIALEPLVKGRGALE
jgi:hypothetical protein